MSDKVNHGEVGARPADTDDSVPADSVPVDHDNGRPRPVFIKPKLNIHSFLIAFRETL